MNDQGVAMLPPHTVRISSRARRVSLRIVEGKGLEVVLPYGVPRSVVPDVLQRHSAWVARQLGKHAARQAVAPDDGPVVPRHIHFVLTGESYGVERASVSKLFHDTKKKALVLPLNDAEALKGLRAWLLRAARAPLGDVLAVAAAETGIGWSTLRVGLQRTRWGSCSYRGGISLNAKLLFVSRQLVRHVVLHELCHVIHRNHGQSFHALLRTLDPQAVLHAKALRIANRDMPAWTRIRRDL